ncbi:hypothetical protein KJA13_01225 [Patescibacteria group bacterium]|nr:hypothetical protein [Patescibacteria group bacterium]
MKALDFDKLYEILRSKRVIAGSKYNYEAHLLIDRINQIREDLEDSRREGEIKELTPEGIGRFITENENLKEQIRNITRKEGLRTKVIELAIDEVIERATKN